MVPRERVEGLQIIRPCDATTNDGKADVAKLPIDDIAKLPGELLASLPRRLGPITLWRRPGGWSASLAILAKRRKVKKLDDLFRHLLGVGE